MARTGKTAQEFIQSSFSPIISVLCSPNVDKIVSKNNLSFSELLQPFTNLDWEGQFRDPNGSVCSVKNWKLIIRDIGWKPLQPTEARKQLNNAVLHNYNDKTVSLELAGRKLDIPQSTPWFDAWRETYFEVQFPSDHEFTKHFISCIIVATTYEENIVDTFNSLNAQYAQLQTITPPKLPKWFNNSVLKSYLLLHDVSAVSKEKADAAYETLMQNFGAGNCFMLPINSRNAADTSLPTDFWKPFINRTESNTEISSLTASPFEPPPTFPPSNAANLATEDNATVVTQEGVHPLTTNDNDIYDNANSLQTYSFSGSSDSVNVGGKTLDNFMEVHGAALNNNDIDSIKKFLQEYASKSLLPYFEKLISQLTELVANRKGVSRSLLSATKRWFGTGKGGNTTGSSNVIYSTDCPELQLRRLADLWFLCGQWQRAFDTYHTAKREFYADSAWLCYAGALEMAAISAFMAGESNRKTHGYMEEGIVTYLNTCRMVQYAVRATLLSILCLSSTGLHGEAAKQLIRMTSEDSDLRSAMLLEQAALCFLAGPGSKAMSRKYAFPMVLSGHRFSKAGQKKHAYRCYNQAYQVYESSGWRLSTDHVQFALGRLAGALRRPRAAVRWLRAPLAPPPLTPAPTPQPAHQQDAFLREYMLAHQQWVDTSDEFKDRLPSLPLPLLESEATAVLCVGPAPLSSPGRSPATSISLKDLESSSNNNHIWHKLEQMLLQVAQGNVPMIFKPTIDLYTQKTDSNPAVPQGEPIQICITLRNPLKISLVLKDLELLWQFISNTDEVNETRILNNESMIATGTALENNIIYTQKIKSVMMEGESKRNLVFSLTPMNVGQLSIQGLSYKLINAGENGVENNNGIVISGKLDLTSGNGCDKRLHINVIPHAPCLQMTFSETSTDVISGEMRTIDVEFKNVGPVDMHNIYIAVSHPDCVSVVTADNDIDDFKLLYEDKYREPLDLNGSEVWRLAAARHVRAGPGGALPPGGGARARLLLRPSARAPHLHVLAYYEPPAAASPVGHRLLRHVFRFHVTEAIEVSLTPRRSLRTTTENPSEMMNLAVEIKNISKEDKEVTIEVLQACLLSRQWRMTTLTAAKNKDDPLASHETLHLIFKAERILDELPEYKVEQSCLKVAENHPDAVQNIDTHPYSKFITEYKPTFIETEESHIHDTGSKRGGLIRSMFILRWKIQDKKKDRTAIGQHSMWLECFRKIRSRERELVLTEPIAFHLDDYDNKTDMNETKKKSKENVVIFKMNHLSQIYHDFKQRKLCLVPITINIVNCYAVPVKAFIDMMKQKNRETTTQLGWAGALSDNADVEAKELGVSVFLGKFESRRIQVRAICAAPGTYLIASAFTITTVNADDNSTVTNLSNNTSLLVVQQA